MALCGVVHGYLIALLNSQSFMEFEWLIYSYRISLKTCFFLNSESKFPLKVLLDHKLIKLLEKYPEFGKQWFQKAHVET